MANTTIPNLPAAVSLDGNEQLEVVQNGTSKRVTADQIAALAENTQGTVTEINTGGALVGGPITTTGTISLPPDAVTNAYLAEMPTNTVKANLTGLTANPTDVTPSAILDTFGSAEGSMLYRGVSSWEDLAPGTGGYYLTTTGNLPQWTALAVGPGDLTPTGVTPGTYGTASQVAQLTVNAAGQLTAASNVAISIPAGQVTGLGTMATQNANSVAITGGNIDGTIIGATTPAQAYFTTIPQGVWNGTPIGLAYGGTGGTDAATARTNLGLGTMAVQNASAVAITGGTMNGVSIGGSNPQAGTFTTLSVSGNSALNTVTSGTWNGNAIGVAYGGTGATTASGARTNLGAAASGANSDITSLTGLTTPLSAPQGGTGFGSYTEGDLLYAVTSSSLGRLNDIAVGNVLLSGGVGVAPAYGKVDLTTHITGTLPVANGGTGATTLTGYVKGNGTSAFTAAATIPNSDLQNSSVTIGSTTVALGASTSTLAGLTSVTLTQDPTLALQASTKQYVDDQVATVSNLTYHTQVTATTTGNLNANYSNGTGGIGATLTNAGALAQFQIDSYTPGPLARVLIKDQTNAYENGIYEVTTQGDAISVPWVLTRTADFDSTGSGPNNIQTGASVFVQSGVTWGSTSWVMVTTGTINVGSTNLVWTQTSSSGNILVNAPLSKSGNTISLGTVTVPFGGTGQTSYTIGDLLYADSSSSLAKLADVATGNVLRSGGIGVAPAWGKVDLTTDVTGTLPVANGGSGTSTAFTAGSVLFAGASGVYSQNNANFFWDNTNTRLGIHTNTPDATLTLMSETQTAVPPGALPAGTDFHVIGANGAETRITQDAFGTGNYPAYTGRHARGTAASPSATQSGDILSQYTGRGYGATGYNSASTGVFEFLAAENFTDSAQGTYASMRLTATGAASPTEVFRIGPVGQLGIGGSSYGTANQLLTSGGSSAAPSWQSGINVTTLTASSTVTMSATTDNISIGTSQTTGLLSLGGASQTGATSIAPSTKSITISLGGGATESGETKTLNLGTAGVSGSTTAINIGASASTSTSNTTLYGNVRVNNLTVSKPVFTDGSGNFTSSGTLASDQGGTGLTSYSVGDLLYYATGTALSKLGIGTNGQILTSNGSAPVWTSGSSISVNTATNIAGGLANQIPYQSAPSTTTFSSSLTFDGTTFATTTVDATNVEVTNVKAKDGTAAIVISDTSGNVGIGGTAQGNIKVHALGTYPVLGGNANCAAFGATGTFPTGITGTARGFFSSLATAASSTITSVLHFNAGNTQVGAGATLTNEIGFFAGSGITSGTNNYGFYGDIASGSNRYNVYMAGTADNYFAGNVGIGTASPGFLLDVSNTSTAVDYISGRYISSAAASGESRTWLKVEKGANYGGAIAGYLSQGVGSGLIFGTQNATSTPVERMRITNDGNVGIGTATPTNSAGYSTLSLNGSTGGQLVFQTGGTYKQTIYSSTTDLNILNGQAGSLTFGTNNTERMRIDSSGNVGIGLTPTYKLDVGATTGSNVIRVGGGNSGAADGGGVYVANNGTSVAAFGNYSNIIGGGYDASALLWATGNMRFVTAGGANVRMTIDTSGNVGIGTSSPATRLDILAVDAVTTSIRLGGTAASGGGATATVEVFGNRPDGNSTFYGRYGASFRRADGTAINNQPVGAYLFGGQWGTSTSFQSANMLYTASIAGVAESSWTSATAMPTAITFSTGSSGGILGSANQAYGTERMRISSAGNVGIATSSASQRLAINSANTSTNCLIEWRQGDVIQGYTGFGTDNALRLQTVGTQPVGMVAGGAGYAFISLNGSERARFSAAGGFSVGTTADPGAGAIFATGNITAYYSDARLKDFKGKIGDALYKVSQLNGYYYTENEKAEEFGYNNKELQVGVSAQEVQAVLPEVIAPAPFDMNENNESKSGENYMTVRYEKLVPLLIEAIKELTAKVEALEGKK